MKILLTGGTGFIGQHIHRYLQAESHEVFVLSRKINCDLLDHLAVAKFVDKLEADILIHLAWDVTHGKYWKSPQNNLYRNASINLFESFLQKGPKKIIGAGTCAEYPSSSQAVAENDLVDHKMLTPYGRSKRQIFEWLTANCDNFTWLRIFGIYGSGENPDRFFPKALEAIRTKQQFYIQTPNIFYDYINVEQVAKFVLWSIKNKGVGAVNMGMGVSYSMREWYEFINNGYRHIESSNVKQPCVNSRIPDCQKLMKVYGAFK